MTARDIMCAAAAMMLVACGGKKDETASAPATVKVATVSAVTDGGSWQLPGRVKASEEVNVAFKVAGTLRRINVKEGQRVVAGQPLAEMDDTDYRVQLSATEAEYAGIKAEAERVMALYEQQGTTASNYDKARYGLEQIEAKLAHHRNQLAYCRVKAPVSGTVQTVLFEAGETVGQGMPVVQIVGSGKPEIEVSLPAHVYTHAGDIETAVATFSAYSGHTYRLTPLQTLPKANATGLYTMRLRIEDDVCGRGEKAVRAMPSPGMSGWVTLTASDETSAAVLVPSTAVVHSQKGDFVFVVKGGKAHRQPVTLVSLGGDGQARVEGALQPGETVVATGAHHVADGQSVKPLKAASDTNVGALL